MKRFIIFALLLVINSAFGQDTLTFEKIVQWDANPVESQGKTGTCWSFSTASFLESELLRMKKGSFNLSEIFIARQVYVRKADNYVGRHGKAQFGQGSLSHDLLNAVDNYGLVPNEIFDGLQFGAKAHNHKELAAVLGAYLKVIVSNKGEKLSPFWRKGYGALLDVYLGSYPDNFTYKGRSYTPKSFAESLGIKKQDYVSISSYTHRPFYSSFILDIPDNWDNGSFYNVPLNELITATKKGLKAGYTICWDADVTNEGFDAEKGIAVIPMEGGSPNFNVSFKEMDVTQKIRQENYEDYSVTDDHLMHIVGMAKDNKGKEYFIVKNSWGNKIGLKSFKGHIMVSEAYFRMNTISITIHKEVLPKAWKIK